jgi:tRNA modification GTPase
VIRISGSQALTIAAQLFQPHRPLNLAGAAGYTVRYGRFVDSQQRTIDDGLLTLFRAPRSYTGEDSVEISCHGGRAVTDRLLAALLLAGARLAQPGEFTLRAFLNGRMDLAQAEAVADLIRARTDGARRLARGQLEGELSRAVNAIREELIGILAAIEVTIDFSDEVGELEYAPLIARIGAVRRESERLLATADHGRILREGLRVAIIGRPNVGKSSLLNALLRADRAIVTPIAGTTRDLIEEAADISGIRVVLVDTAGIRATVDPVERIGVERAKQAATTADVTLVVLDATAPLHPDDEALMEAPASDARRVIALNKSDAVEPDALQARASALISQYAFTTPLLQVSARTGQGLDELETALIGDATGGVATSSTEDAVVGAARHREALEAALASLREAEQTALHALPGDFVAIDVRGALDAVGRITGQTVDEEIVHRIFRDFCVGK